MRNEELQEWMRRVVGEPPTQEEIDALTPIQRALSGVPTDVDIVIDGKNYRAKGMRLESVTIGEPSDATVEGITFVSNPEFHDREKNKAEGLLCNKCKRGLSSKEDRNADMFLCCNCDKHLFFKEGV